MTPVTLPPIFALMVEAIWLPLPLPLLVMVPIILTVPVVSEICEGLLVLELSASVRFPVPVKLPVKVRVLPLPLLLESTRSLFRVTGPLKTGFQRLPQSCLCQCPSRR